MENQSLVIFAIDYAAKAHSKQRRKNTDKSPYINHPIEVASMLSQAGVTSANIICAALLHDVVEDCANITLEEIRTQFGPIISTIVGLCSDDKSLPKVDRKKIQLQHAKEYRIMSRIMYTPNGDKVDVHKCALLVKLCDKYSNVRSLIEDPPASWSREEIVGYIVWAHKCTTVMSGINARIDAELENTFYRLFTHYEVKSSDLPQLLEDYYVLVSAQK